MVEESRESLENTVEDILASHDNESNWKWRDLRETSSEDNSFKESQGIEDSEGDRANVLYNSNGIEEARIVEIIQEQVNKLRLGRKRGRPRRIAKINKFFDFALSKKKRVVNKKQQTGRKCNKEKKQLFTNREINGLDSEISDIREVNPKIPAAIDLAEHIYDSTLLMGLTACQEKEETIKKIKKALGEDKQTQII